MFGLLKRMLKNLFMIPSETEESLTVGKRYKHFRRTLFIIMTTVTMIPLLVTAVLSYYQYQLLLEQEAQNHLRWNAESASKTITAFLDELLSVMVFVAEEYQYEDLAKQETLSATFTRLKRKHRGLVDLGFIDPDGIQQTYAGPYDFRGKSYANTIWYQAAKASGSFISNIFLGYRKAPHFVIAVDKKVPGKEVYWVLRASIDAHTLGRFVTTIDTEASDDVFLIDEDGTLQTKSRFYGEVQDEYPLEELPYQTGVTIQKDKSSSILRLHALTYIEGTPWILVLVKRGYIHEKVWSSFQTQLLIIAAITAIIALLVIMRTATLLGNRIRMADEKREVVLSEVEHTNKLASIGRLAAGVAHEINNPLAIISEKAGLMKDLIDLSENFQHKENFNNQIGGVLNAVKRCKVITHRLLGFARRMDVTFESIAINEVIQEVISFLDKEILYRNIRFEISLQEDLPLIQSDRGQLQQIFLNIINNAIDAVGKGGNIALATKLKTESSIQVAIIDDGPGIAPENIKHIFEPFFTTKTTGGQKGTGLGLSITYGLVKKLGGEIHVDSTEKVGTTFIIELPVHSINIMESENGRDKSPSG